MGSNPLLGNKIYEKMMNMNDIVAASNDTVVASNDIVASLNDTVHQKNTMKTS